MSNSLLGGFPVELGKRKVGLLDQQIIPISRP